MAYRHRVRNPIHQARIFLPNWFVKVVRPGKELIGDDDVVQLHVPLDMGKIDIKHYLENIYEIPVAKVHTRIQRGKWKEKVYGNDIIYKKTADYKVAYVFLKEGTFKFPDMFPDITANEVDDDDDDEKDVDKKKESLVDKVGSLKWFN